MKHTKIAALVLLAAGCGLKLPSKSANETENKPNEKAPMPETAGPDRPSDSVAESEDPNQSRNSGGVIQKSVDLNGIVGFALTESTGGSNLNLQDVTAGPSGSNSDAEYPGGNAPQSKGEATSNIFGFDESGKSRPIIFSTGTARFQKIIPTPKAIFLLPGRDSYYGVQNESGAYCRFLVMTVVDGKLYCVTDFGIEYDSRYEKEYLMASQSGDLVTVEGWENGGWSKLFRMDFSTPGTMGITKIYDKEGYPEQWSANNDGDVFVQYSERERKLRMLKANGAFDPLGPGEYVRCLHAGKGLNGNAFFYLYSNGQSNIVRKVAKDNSGVFQQIDFKSANDLGFVFDGCESSLIEEDRHFYAMAQRDNDGSLGDPTQAWNGSANVVELTTSSSPTAVKHAVSGLRYVRKILRAPGNSNKIILVGSNNLGSGVVIAYDTVAKTQVTLLRTGKFVISDAYLSGSAVIFSGERQADSAVVSAKITDFAAEVEPTVTVVGVQKAKQLVPLRR